MQAKAKASPNKASKTDAGSVATNKIDSPQKQGKKRSAAQAVNVVDGTAAESLKRQKKVDADATEADLQVCTHCSRSLTAVDRSIAQFGVLACVASNDLCQISLEL